MSEKPGKRFATAARRLNLNPRLVELARRTRERRPCRLDLGEDVDAVAPLLDHAGHAPHLALDPVQAVEQLGLVGAIHRNSSIDPDAIPPRG